MRYCIYTSKQPALVSLAAPDPEKEGLGKLNTKNLRIWNVIKLRINNIDIENGVVTVIDNRGRVCHSPTSRPTLRVACCVTAAVAKRLAISGWK